MKIVIDHLGKVKSTERDNASASGLLLTNKRQKFALQIGARATPQALLTTCRHIRALNARVTIEAQTKSHLKYFPYPENTVPDTCLGLGRLASRLIEQRYELFRTDILRDFQDPKLGRLPRIMAPLLNPRLFTKETALALAQLDESDLSATSFIMPDGDKGFRIKKNAASLCVASALPLSAASAGRDCALALSSLVSSALPYGPQCEAPADPCGTNEISLAAIAQR